MNTPPDHVLNLFKKTRGAFSVHEAVALYNLAQMAPDGPAIELGSHCGKSSIMAAAGLARYPNAIQKWFHLVDPGYSKENLEAWKHSVQGSPENAWPGFWEDGFCESVIDRVFEGSKVNGSLGLAVVKLHGDYSLNAIPAIGGPFSFAFVDSNDHAYQLCHDECELLRNRMVIGGIIGFHDIFSQFVGVEQAYREMLQGGMYEEVPIDWQSIKEIVKGLGGETGNNSWHHPDSDAPCFLGALKRVK